MTEGDNTAKLNSAPISLMQDLAQLFRDAMEEDGRRFRERAVEQGRLRHQLDADYDLSRLPGWAQVWMHGPLPVVCSRVLAVRLAAELELVRR